MRDKKNQVNIDNSNLVDYPNGRIKNNAGAGDGTPVNEATKGDIHEFFDKLLRLYGIAHNGLPDNETNGYQTIEALIAVASKNDYILELSSASNVLKVPLKLGKLLPNESFIFKAAVNKGTETTIKGTLDNVVKNVTFLGDFKTNEYVRAVNLSGEIVLIRMIDYFNLDTVTASLNYLKAANQTQEDAGAVSSVASTPLTNLTSFVKRVNGVDSSNYLATQLFNGLLSAADKEKLDNLESKEKNYGTFSPFDVDIITPVGSLAPVSGDITKAEYTTNTTNGEIYTITFANAFDDTNYQVQLDLESLGTMEWDNDIKPLIWKKISKTQINIYLEETNRVTQNLKVHISGIQR